MKWLDAVRTRLRLMFARRAAESRMNQEFRLHIDLEAEHLVREQGLAPDEAHRRAIAAFGGVEKHKDALREGRGLAWLGGLALDLKLAFRMLVRYPGLTLVGGAAMAFGIAAGVGVFEIRTQVVDPSLPLEEGSRIVGLRPWDISLNRPVATTPADVKTWRGELKLVEDVSAFTAFQGNLITSNGSSEAEAVAAMSASAFHAVRVAPLFGRTLLEADEGPGAPAVIVIGHEIWKRRFGSDPGVLGQTVRLGRVQRTVVGVMPEGFAFPAAHGLWIPLANQAGSPSGEDPGLLVFGRLRPRVSRTAAQAELNVVGLRALNGPPQAREHLQLQVVPFSRLMFDSVDVQIGLAIANVFVVMLLVLVCGNVALLMFARAAARETEIAVRSALGAGRARIVTQLFLEALALAGVSVAAGLAVAKFGLRWSLAARLANSGQPLPFWINDRLTTSTVIYAGALTIVSAAIIGILPALSITGRGHQFRLRQSSAGGGGVRFGGIWTFVIAAQVAVTVMFPAWAFFFHRWVAAGQTRDLGIPAARYLSARLELDRENGDATEPAFRSRMRSTYAELERRVSAEAAVSGLTFADRLPGTGHSLWRIEIDGETTAESSVLLRRVASASVALNFFDVLGAPIVAGRAFTAADLDSSHGVVIVNESFVTHVVGAQNPIGRRVRRGPAGSRAPGPWLEIVGVVRDLGMGSETKGAGLYQPITPDRAAALRVAIGVKGTPEWFAARFRTVAGEVEPTLQIHELMPLDDAGASQASESEYAWRLMAGLAAIALLLSLTAIYSVTAFTVSRRTREIGIRVALGADRRRVIGVILRRPLVQVGLGICAGAVLVGAVFVAMFEGTPSAREAVLIGAYAMVMLGICLLACVVPTRRALQIEPAEALRVDR